MHLIDLLQNLVEMPTPAKTMVISGLVADSRRVGHGNLFFALNGTSDDGYNYSKHAINSGAVAILGDSRPFDNDVKKLAKASNVILLNCENPRWVMSQAAARYWPKRPNMVAAVTGTNGKTSTAEFLRQIWRRASWKTATLGTLGIIGSDSFSKKDSILDLPQLTTPDCLSLHSIINDLSKAGMTHLALEASSHGLEQYRLDGLEIHVAGFTNLSRDHLDHHLDMGAYFSSKLRLFTELLKPGGCAVINLDDPFSEKILEQIVTREIVVKTFGYSEKADFCIKSISPSGDGLDMVVNHQGKTWNIPLALSGTFQAVNALGAAVIAHSSGLPLHDSLGALPFLIAAPGRMQSIHGHPLGARVVIDYAHTPEALEAALGALRPEASGKLMVVFGCGGNRDSGKRELMGNIAAKIADNVIVTDDNPREESPAQIRSEIIAACPSAEEIFPRDKAINYAIKKLGFGDVLLIAGKGHESVQLVGNETLPFDDSAVANNIIKNLKGSAL